LSSLVL